jgi:hypothetical protein
VNVLERDTPNDDGVYQIVYIDVAWKYMFLLAVGIWPYLWLQFSI